mmetsp:Transcript_13338/g.49551  ORF Transcript_13338/g.49551 Transcript_13338/m.49551 type:complete len:252 (+) Transcript_13338:5351-6106(+)
MNVEIPELLEEVGIVGKRLVAVVDGNALLRALVEAKARESRIHLPAANAEHFRLEPIEAAFLDALLQHVNGANDLVVDAPARVLLGLGVGEVRGPYEHHATELAAAKRLADALVEPIGLVLHVMRQGPAQPLKAIEPRSRGRSGPLEGTTSGLAAVEIEDLGVVPGTVRRLLVLRNALLAAGDLRIDLVHLILGLIERFVELRGAVVDHADLLGGFREALREARQGRCEGALSRCVRLFLQQRHTFLDGAL